MKTEEGEVPVTLACGPSAEERVVRLILDPGRRPAWLLDARRTVKDSPEDRAGIDVVVETADNDALLLQVKASDGAARQFLKRRATLLARPIIAPHLPPHLAVVVAPAEKSDDEVWARTLAALGSLRADRSVRRKLAQHAQ